MLQLVKKKPNSEGDKHSRRNDADGNGKKRMILTRIFQICANRVEDY